MSDPICARCNQPVSLEDRAPLGAELEDLLHGNVEVFHRGCLLRGETIALVERFVDEHERASRRLAEEQRAEEEQAAKGRELLKKLYESDERQRAASAKKKEDG